MMRSLMKLVSAIFHPLLLSTYLVLVFAYLSPELFTPIPGDYLYIVVLATFVSTCFMPGLSIVALRLTSKITNFDITHREERFLPFVSIATFYGAAAYMFSTKMMLSAPFTVMMYITTALILLLLVITFWTKISIHAAALWSTSGIVTAYLLYSQDRRYAIVLIACFMIAGLVSTSRLYLGRHEISEVWLGTFTGFGFSFSLCQLFF